MYPVTTSRSILRVHLFSLTVEVDCDRKANNDFSIICSQTKAHFSSRELRIIKFFNGGEVKINTDLRPLGQT